MNNTTDTTPRSYGAYVWNPATGRHEPRPVTRGSNPEPVDSPAIGRDAAYDASVDADADASPEDSGLPSDAFQGNGWTFVEMEHDDGYRVRRHIPDAEVQTFIASFGPDYGLSDVDPLPRGFVVNAADALAYPDYVVPVPIYCPTHDLYACWYAHTEAEAARIGPDFMGRGIG